MTTAVLADDQEIVRAGLQLILEHRGVDVLGAACNGREAVELAGARRPDVVLMDIRMPVLDGIAATREIVTAGLPSKVLILTTYDLDRYLYGALKAGAAGFLLKATPPERLVAGIETVAAGDALLAPELTRRLIEAHLRGPEPARNGIPAALRDLTPRELEVFELIGRGLSNEQIATRITVAATTVKTHINRILAKLTLTSRAQAVVLAYESGLIRPGT
ncbi:MAG TPA: response regulator transcription factor [Kribbella sp.]|nr:response regulator transcription factor [Kribbella sp.]